MRVELTGKARQQLAKLPKNQQKKVVKKLLLLESSPFLGKLLSGDLSNIYSLRAWPYRIFYTIDEMKKKVSVINIEHRQGAYK